MGVCGVSSASKKTDINKNNIIDNNNENSIYSIPTIKKKKNQVIVSVKYNDYEKLVLLLDKNQKLSELYNQMKLDLQYDYDFYDSNLNIINDKINEPIEKNFDINNPLIIIIKQYNLKIPKNIREYFSINTSLIGTLTFNNSSLLGIFIYNISLNQIFSYEYPFQDYPKLQFINKLSSFCNSNNSIYISGGENLNEGNYNFVKINLKDISPNELVYNNLTSLNYKRYWHSMIFIPEKYIFIIGGPGMKETEIYDIDLNEIKVNGKLNYERCEPSLILVNQKYLYCICGFELNNNFVDTIEKCNLIKKEINWEIVNYQIKNEEDKKIERNHLLVSFFGVSYVNDDILLIGDKDNNKIINPNYLLKPSEKDIDIIVEYGFIESNNTRLFSEKFFIPFNNNESIALPFKFGDPKILILNNSNGNIKEIILKENNEDNEENEENEDII